MPTHSLSSIVDLQLTHQNCSNEMVVPAKTGALNKFDFIYLSKLISIPKYSTEPYSRIERTQKIIHLQVRRYTMLTIHTSPTMARFPRRYGTYELNQCNQCNQCKLKTHAYGTSRMIHVHVKRALHTFEELL